ncbi:MAG: molybdenum cofactor biosynthesis protein MoaE [Pseudomonadota bacterium]
MDVSSRIRIIETPFAPGDELAQFQAKAAGAGAIVSFSGLVRAADADRTVLGLDLQHFPGFTEKRIAAFCETALQRWPLQDLTIVHRVGAMVPGEPIVFVATAAAHRRAAFEAADYLMDYLKSEAPFWKKERREDGDVWIEPGAEDKRDKSRWDKA